MPFYEYRCESCGKTFELFQKMGTTEEDTQCPHCQSEKVKRIFSPFASPGKSDSSQGGGFTGGC